MHGKTATLRDIADEVGLTTMTVSKALRNQPGVKASTRARIVAAAERLNYRGNLSASMLKSGRSGIVRIIVNEYNLPFYSQLIDALSAEVLRNGMTPFLQETRYSVQYAQEAMRNPMFDGSMFDGSIIQANGLSDSSLREIQANGPTVLLDSCLTAPTISTVNWPNEEGVRAAVQHLIDRGCSNIGIVTTSPYLTARELMADHDTNSAIRLRGARAALVNNNLPYDPAHVITIQGLAEPQARELAHRLADGHAAFDGYACMNDSAALGLIRGFADQGVRVPQDARVIGFDGIRTGEFSVPSLSTIVVDLDQLAQLAVAQILRQISDPDNNRYPTVTTVGYQLIERESTR